mmetsp:Transcript_33524/g.72439  ORF Transcript_33524/g.72439 Transcript_33524/m.72439 type:complete len:103 (-) Transcript_33524:702-1010(-)
MDSEENSEVRDEFFLPEFFAMYKSLGGSADEVEYRQRLKSFFLHTLHTCVYGYEPTATQDEKGYRFYASREEAMLAFMEAEQVTHDEYLLIFRSVDNVHAYT